MPIAECRFRPWLDDPGRWPDWDPDDAERAGLAAAMGRAGEDAIAFLTQTYGKSANTFGAISLIEAQAAAAQDMETLRLTARAIMAHDHYCARSGVARARPGGLTNRANQNRWARLRPYLVARSRHLLERNAAESMTWRAILERVPDSWVPTAAIATALRRQAESSGLFERVEIMLDLRLPTPGGRAWIAARCADALCALRDSLRLGEPCLVELIREPGTTPTAAQIVVVYRLRDDPDPDPDPNRNGTGEGVVLSCYDPALGDQPMTLRLSWRGTEFIASESHPTDMRGAIKALRLVALEDARPPLFGWRRRLRWPLPWCALWWIKRHWLLLVTPGREIRPWPVRRRTRTRGPDVLGSFLERRP